MAVSADRFTQEYWTAPRPLIRTPCVHRDRAARRRDWWRKGHSHIDESQIWLAHIGGAVPHYEAVTKDAANNAWPMWSGDGRRCTSCPIASGSENIWATPVARRRRARAVTSFKSGRVVWPTIAYDGKTIVFERNFGDLVARRREWQSGARCRSRCAARAPSPASSIKRLRKDSSRSRCRRTERKIAFVARGEVFAASARDGGDATRITNYARARDPSSRGRRTAGGWPTSRAAMVRRTCSSTTSATRTETQAHRRPAATTSTRRGRPTARRSRSDRGGKELRVVDVADRQDRVFATGQLDRPPFLSDDEIAWSPDGQWIAYRRRAERAVSRILTSWHCSGGEARPISFLPNGARRSRSPGARTARICCSTRRSERRLAGCARRSRAAHAAISRGSVPRPVSTAAVAPGHARPIRRHDRRRRSATAPRFAPTRPTPRRATATQIVFDDIRRRISFLPVGVDARSVDHQSRRQDGVAQCRRRRPGESLYVLARRVGARHPRRAAAHVHARLQGQTRSSAPTAKRSTTSRMGGST